MKSHKGMFSRMANSKRINGRTETDTGFGNNGSAMGDRMILPNGKPNITVEGRRHTFDGYYHSLLEISGMKFIGVLLLTIFILNIFFAFIYYLVGTHQIAGAVGVTSAERFEDAIFFSIQTFSGLGYGRLNPMTITAGWISSIEAIVGFMSIALFTGLLFTKFSMPIANLAFAKKALVAPYKDGRGLMVRICPNKGNFFIDPEVAFTLMMPQQEENGSMALKFYTLKVEMSKVSMLSTNWTIVHHIDETSPLFSLTKEDFENLHGEVILNFKAFDHLYSNQVVTRISYTFDQIVYGAKFDMMYKRSDDGKRTILMLDKLSDFERVKV
ncbi:MAG: Inward rectifier potassium channel Irk [Saprospiraceae bacterium]|uniref:ion channel n=1 Tax=Candidatus Brachybacter algidus TaxID=2982024 RepID=UPI001EBEECF0|nr:ion channel [Candidatus Brachybacter algidus]MBK7602325.1 Inward rectifier potassium channel Irk [Candidatus Brachybacter algidus]MBL0117581.1 Inward rectifier potassium channel Irk [Candidatus Brachybacter algidus]